MSTASDLRNELVGVIEALWEELGYATEDDALVHDRMPEHTASSMLNDYFWASLSNGSQAIRAWAVDTLARPDFDRKPEETTSIVVTATVRAWYGVGVDGEGLTALRTHLSLVQQGIVDLGITLGGHVIRILEWSDPDISVQALEEAGDEGEAIFLEFRIVGDNPNGTI